MAAEDATALIWQQAASVTYPAWWSKAFAREPAEPPDDQGELDDAPHPPEDPEPWVWELCPPCTQLLVESGIDMHDDNEEPCFCRLTWPAAVM